MVRCEEFYRVFEKKGNFCNKSEVIVKKVEEYIAYIRSNHIGTYKISNCALDPFINIEFINEGTVHRHAVKELKKLIKKGKILPEKITRRMSIELINKANANVSEGCKLVRIPGIRSRMGELEHDIGNISHEVRSMFDDIKADIGIKNNDQAMKIMMEYCVRNPNDLRQIKEEMENKEKAENGMSIVKSA